jgi:UDP-N-acetylglucosamine acyltransferase
MAFSHVGHDCVVGDHNIFANAATLAGHVEIEHHSYLSGQVAVHQFCRIGAYALVAGVSGVPQDVPPFVMADGHRARIIGLNSIGLRRGGFTQEQRNRIKGVYRIIFRSGLRLPVALEKAEQTYPSSETQQIVRFIQSARRGLLSYAR